ncbi:MAG: deoxyguanosinetriphosphate triphosphohydrolase [Spirochaetota bacterium]
MIKSMQELIWEEDAKLAPYAVKNQQSRERMYPEEEHPYRLPLQRDRDRLFHCRAFKRLEYKTQVFINSHGDNFRTRLTHTLEVAGVSRTIATSLGLNSRLAEVIALAHDIGHAPFGHAGQDILSELMKAYGGFEHNKQSLRVLSVLENRYPKFAGLNLCKVTLTGIMKHAGQYTKDDLLQARQEEGPSLEAMVSDIADEIAYNTHDIEDGLEKGYITPENLTEVSIWKEQYALAKEEFPQIEPILLLRHCFRRLMNTIITGVLQASDEAIQTYQITDRDTLKSLWKKSIRVVRYSEETEPKIRELKRFLQLNLYHHPKVKKMGDQGKQIIEVLFQHYSQYPEKIADSYRKRIDSAGKYRVICDYIAGMTDRYATLQYEALGGKNLC